MVPATCEAEVPHRIAERDAVLRKMGSLHNCELLHFLLRCRQFKAIMLLFDLDLEFELEVALYAPSTIQPNHNSADVHS
jgi:hypothetical protein